MLSDKINLTNKKQIIVLTILLLIVLRAHTFFNDYYDRDELAQMVYAVEAEQSSNLFYGPYGSAVNIVFNLTAKLFGHFNWRMLHLLAIFFILLTSFMIYLIVRNLKNDEMAGLYSAFFYAVFASIGYKDFYNLSAEIIFNSYISISFYFFSYALFKSKKIITKIIYIGISLIFAYLIYNSKMHAMFYLFIYLFSIPLLIKNQKKRFVTIFIILFSILSFFIISLIFEGRIFNTFKSHFQSALSYIYAGNLSLSFLLFRISTILILFTLAQFPVWYFCIKFIKNKISDEYDIPRSIILLFFIISFIPAILTLRFYPHYFIQPLLPASLMSGIYLYRRLYQNDVKVARIKINLTRYISIITIVIFVLSFGLVTAKTIYPHIGSKLQMFWPDTKLIPLINWLKENKIQNQKIFIWGDAPEIFYYTKNSSGPFPLWYSVLAKSYFLNPDINVDQQVISNIEKENIKYIIDTQPADFSGFGKYPLNKLIKLNNYIQTNFEIIAEVNRFIVYTKRSR